MAAYCPIGSATVDQSIIRGVALLTLTAVTIFLATGYDFILIYQLFDFFMRGFVSRKLSLFNWLARSMARTLACRVAPVNAEPKIFAARIGFIICLLLLLCRVLALDGLVYALGAALMTAAGLEGFFSICLGCHLHAVLTREWPSHLADNDSAGEN